ncbi:MAG: 50S ribosomal protein L25 [Patescibacteria group bacterium]
MQHARIEAKTREIRGRKTIALRAEGKVPAVMYGFETEPKMIELDRNAFVKVYSQAGESTVVDLEIEGVNHPVLISEIQRDPLTDFITHADFRRVDPKRKIEAKIPFKLVGLAPAVKELGGTLLQTLEELEVMSLPDALVHEIEVDVSKLATFEDIIRVKDLVIPEGIEIKSDLEQAVASVQPPRSEEEMAALDSAVDADVSKVEVLTEKKEEAAEGDAAKKE